MTGSRLRKFGSVLFAGILAAGMFGITADTSDARKRGGSGKHHAHSHHKPQKHRPHHGNRHHHHSHDRWHHRGDHYGRWVARGVAAGVTAAALGSILYSLPGGCRVVYSGGAKFWNCGGVWYRARYRGSDITYVVVNAP